MVHNTTLNNYYSIVHAMFNILIKVVKSYNKIIILLGYNYTSMHACQSVTFWHCTICSNALMQLHYTIGISSYNYYKPGGVYTYQPYKRFLSNSEFKYVALRFTTAIFLEFHSLNDEWTLISCQSGKGSQQTLTNIVGYWWLPFCLVNP